MSSPHTPYPPNPYAPQPTRPRVWWQHPALIVTALVLLPPAGIALAWLGRWTTRGKIIATVLSGLWFLLFLLAPEPEEPGVTVEGKPAPTVTRTVTATPSASPATSVRPSESAGPTDNATMPDVVGVTFNEAGKTVEALIDGDLTAGSAYTDVGLAADHTTWKVCFQSPDVGSALVPASAAPSVGLVAPGVRCPAGPDTELHPDPSPTPTPAPRDDSRDEADNGTSADPGSDERDSDDTGGGGSAYYQNCDAVRAAGAAPLHRGQPGYRPGLDRDGDGLACDN